MDFSARLIDAILIDFYRIELSINELQAFLGACFITFVDLGHINILPFHYGLSTSLSFIS